MSTDNLFTDIRIFPITGTSNLKANGKVVIAGTVEVSFKIMNGKNGMFVSLPSEKKETPGEITKYFPQVKIVDQDTKAKMDEVVLAEYNKGTNSTGNKVASPAATAIGAAPAKKRLPF